MKWFFIFMSLAGVIALISGFLFASSFEHRDDLPCYDNKGNVIQELTCEGTSLDLVAEVRFFLSILLIWLVGAIFILIYLFLWLLFEDDEDGY